VLDCVERRIACWEQPESHWLTFAWQSVALRDVQNRTFGVDRQKPDVARREQRGFKIQSGPEGFRLAGAP
jgi:hypothetical protein